MLRLFYNPIWKGKEICVIIKIKQQTDYDLPIYVYGQPVLRQEAEDITPDYPNLKELIQNMFETMDRADGVGLAAPQVGLPIRVVVVNLDVLSDDMPEFKDFKRVYINPHILETGDEMVSMKKVV